MVKETGDRMGIHVRDPMQENLPTLGMNFIP